MPPPQRVSVPLKHTRAAAAVVLCSMRMSVSHGGCYEGARHLPEGRWSAAGFQEAAGPQLLLTGASGLHFPGPHEAGKVPSRVDESW